MADNSTLIQETLQAAREAVKAGHHRRAIALFEDCLRLSRPRRGVKNNTIVYYHNSIAYSRLLLKQYRAMLESLVRAFAYLDLSTQAGINALTWILTNSDLVRTRLGAKVSRHNALFEKLTLPARELNSLAARLLPAGKLKSAGKKSKVRKIHGLSVRDPYFFLEDSNNEAAKVWLDKERQRSRQVMQLLAEHGYPQDAVAAGWAQLHWLPFRCGDSYFCSEIKLYSRYSIVRRFKSLPGKGAKGKGRIVFDSEKVLKDNEDLAGVRYSANGRWLLYGASPNGSDQSYWRIRDLATGRDLPGQIDNVLWGTINFTPDNKGVLFQKAADGKDQAGEEGVGYRASTYYRAIGSSRQRLIHSPYRPEAVRSWVEPFLGGSYLLVSENRKGSQNCQVYLRANLPRWQTEVNNSSSLAASEGAGAKRSKKKNKASRSKTKSNSRPLELFSGQEGRYSFIGVNGRKLLFLSHYRAPRGRIIALEMNRDFSKVLKRSVVVPQGQDNILQVDCNKKNIVVVTLPLDTASSRITFYNLDGVELKRLELPFPGFVGGISLSNYSDEFFFSISSQGRPTEHYVYDFNQERTRLIYGSTFKPNFEVVTKIVKVQSADGALVPMFLSFRADHGRKPAPCLMSVYGGFNASLVPHFNFSSLCWIEMGGIWAQPCLRGDGLLGEDWHRQALKLNKRRTFDDAYACARYLIDSKLSHSSLLAVSGASNGGLTVGALLTQYPRVFAAAIISNGLLDMLNFAEHTNGWSWTAEYGSIANKREFENIFSYSPYQQVQARSSYPPVFFYAADSDDRVPPWHTYKFAAKLAATPNFRSLLYISSSQGHGSWRPSNLMLDKLMFLKFILGEKNFRANRKRR